MSRVVNKRVTNEFDVYIGRPSEWGNPFSHRNGTLAQFKVATVAEAIESYRIWLWREVQRDPAKLNRLRELDGKTLGCWCAPGPCHGDVLIEAARWAANNLDPWETL